MNTIQRSIIRAARTSRSVVACTVIAIPGALMAQGIPFSVSVSAGSEMERYLRILGLVGKAPGHQWTVRALGPSEVEAITPPAKHPWMSALPAPDSAIRRKYSIVAPSVALRVNSSAPFGFNDGPAWAGKGLTAIASGGARAVAGPLSLTLDPTAFIAQNADFRIADNGLSGDRRFGDWSWPAHIDQPQRFGESAYGRLDPGESELRIEGRHLAAGVSTRAEVWGPANEHPLILGNNAGGIPRLFAGTSAPVELRGVTLHGRVMWGQLRESAYGPDTGTSRRHFATAVVGALGVKRLPGLEIGGARFFHTSWPADGLRSAHWFRVIQAFIKSDASAAFGDNPDNQLASAFVRVAPPGRGFEVYGEFGREDRNASFRDLLLEPDHIAAHMVGFARAWADPEAARITVVRGELLNARISHLQQQRPQTPWYVHAGQNQGHTYRGQVLGSAGAFGGGASVVAVDRYGPGGRSTVRWDRIVRATAQNAQGLPVSGRADVVHAIGFERGQFTKRGELTIGGTLAKEFNRYFADDAMNASIRASYRIVR